MHLENIQYSLPNSRHSVNNKLSIYVSHNIQQVKHHSSVQKGNQMGTKTEEGNAKQSLTNIIYWLMTNSCNEPFQI